MVSIQAENINHNNEDFYTVFKVQAFIIIIFGNLLK